MYQSIEQRQMYAGPDAPRPAYRGDAGPHPHNGQPPPPPQEAEEPLPPLPPLSDPPAPTEVNGVSAHDVYQIVAALHLHLMAGGEAKVRDAVVPDPVLASTVLRVLHESGRLVNPGHPALSSAAGFSALHNDLADSREVKVDGGAKQEGKAEDGEEDEDKAAAASGPTDPRQRTKVCLPGDVDALQLSNAAAVAAAAAVARRRVAVTQEAVDYQEAGGEASGLSAPQDPATVTLAGAAEGAGLFLGRPHVPPPPLPPGYSSWLTDPGLPGPGVPSHLAAHYVPPLAPRGPPGLPRPGGYGAHVKSEVKVEPWNRL